MDDQGQGPSTFRRHLLQGYVPVIRWIEQHVAGAPRRAGIDQFEQAVVRVILVTSPVRARVVVVHSTGRVDREQLQVGAGVAQRVEGGATGPTSTSASDALPNASMASTARQYLTPSRPGFCVAAIGYVPCPIVPTAHGGEPQARHDEEDWNSTFLYSVGPLPPRLTAIVRL